MPEKKSQGKDVAIARRGSFSNASVSADKILIYLRNGNEQESHSQQ